MSNSNTMPRIAQLALGSETTAAHLFWISTFAVLTAVGAQIEIPHAPVPFTLQTFFVLLAGGMLGSRNGAASMLLYLAIGAAGLPVFALGGAGVLRLAGPTGGYLLAFPAAAFVIGKLINMRTELWWRVVVLFAGLTLIFLSGTIQLNLVLLHDWNAAFKAGFLIFSWWDVVKLSAAAGIIHYYYSRIR